MTDDARPAEPDPPDDSGFEALRPDAVGGDPPPLDMGGFDLGSLLGAAQDMTAKLAEAQEEIASTVVEGTSGGGMVTVSLDGAYEVHQVVIDPSVVDAAEVSLLEDLIVAAFRDAASQVAELHAGANPMDGLDLGSLGGLLGG